MAFRFASGSVRSFERCIKFGFRIHALNIQTHVLIRIQYLLKFIFPKQPVVYKNAMKIFSDGLMNQCRSYRGIHPS